RRGGHRVILPMPKTPLLFLVASVACALALGVAAPARAEDPAQPQYVTASGPVVAVSVDSVTVGSLRCSVPAEKLADFTALHLLVGQLVKMYCAVSGDHTVLAGIARTDATTTAPQPQVLTA